MLESLCFHWYLYDKMLRNVETEFSTYVQSRFIFPAKLICYFYETQISQCFLMYVEHYIVTQSTSCHCRVQTSFNSFQSWAGTFSLITFVAGASKRNLTKTMIFENRFFCRYTKDFLPLLLHTFSSRHNEATFLHHWKIENFDKEILPQHRLYTALT